MHRTVNSKVQDLIPAHDNLAVPPFRDTLFHMSAIDNDYLAICACIDMIHMRNETLIIWLRRKVYCMLYVHSLIRYSTLKAMM